MTTIAVDLDGTLFEWGKDDGVECGELIEGADDALKAFLGMGLAVVVHSCRATWPRGGGWQSIARALAKLGFAAALADMKEGPSGDQAWQVQLVGPADFGMKSLAMDPSYWRRQPIGIWVGKGKPIASWYVDDRGVTFDPAEGWAPIVERIRAETA